MRYRSVFVILFFFMLSNCKAQDTFQNTLSFKEGMSSPKASLHQAAWIEGHWRGEAFGGVVDEIWGPPLGDSMLFSFKLVADNAVQFYEIGGIRQTGETLIFQLKHFGNDFKGWEEKDETIDAKLVKIETDKVYFDGFTFERVSKDEMNVYVVISENEKTEEVKFNYKRYK